MNIPEAAIEAAAKAAHLRKLTGVQWGDMPGWKRSDRLSEARAALEAAAPFIAAQALRDAADTLYTDTGSPHPLSTATWLRSRADSIEAGN